MDPFSYKGQLCGMYQNDICKFGDHCNFAHGLEEVRAKDQTLEDYLVEHRERNPELTFEVHKILVPFEYQKDTAESCSEPKQAADKIEESQIKYSVQIIYPPTYKKKKCDNFYKKTGCSMGICCQFVHGEVE